MAIIAINGGIGEREREREKYGISTCNNSVALGNIAVKKRFQLSVCMQLAHLSD